MLRTDNIGKNYWLQKVNTDIINWERSFGRSADQKQYNRPWLVNFNFTMEFLAKIINGFIRYLCFQKAPSHMFERALNTYLLFSRNANGVNVIPLNEFFLKKMNLKSSVKYFWINILRAKIIALLLIICIIWW